MPMGVYIHHKVSLVDRFWMNVKKSEDCWLWTGPLAAKPGKRNKRVILPYGRLSLSSQRSLRAHRYSWELHFGSILTGMFVCHHCDQTLCVRPSHLFLGTARDNNIDMASKHRARNAGLKGIEHWAAKLTEAEVLKIRRQYKLGSITQATLAKEYHVSRGAICDITRGTNWKHLPNDGKNAAEVTP